VGSGRYSLAGGCGYGCGRQQTCSLGAPALTPCPLFHALCVQALPRAIVRKRDQIRSELDVAIGEVEAGIASREGVDAQLKCVGARGGGGGAGSRNMSAACKQKMRGA
jgi:hypothetical protein